MKLLRNSFILLMLFTTAVFSQNLHLYGVARPGDLVFGKAAGISKVILNKKVLKFDKNGWFVFGFDRNAKGIYRLKVKFKDGKKFVKKFILHKRKYKIQRINNVKKKLVTPPKSQLKKIARQRKIKIESRKEVGKINKAYYASGFIRPVKGGRISGVFGSQRILDGIPKSPHNGLDIAVPVGTPVYAMADGKVLLAADNFYFSGNYILIDHGQGLTSYYLHLRKIYVKKGQFVKKGEKIGEVGLTGRTTGPHLHWAVMWYKNRIDPAELLKIKFN